MTPELVLTNAQIVTREACIRGTVVVRGGEIAGRGRNLHGCRRARSRRRLSDPGARRAAHGQSQAPFRTAAGVRWPGHSAMLAHDALIAASAITTVLDAVALGDINPDSPRVALNREMVGVVRQPMPPGSPGPSTSCICDAS